MIQSLLDDMVSDGILDGKPPFVISMGPSRDKIFETYGYLRG
ncbi:hypothetical protein TDIS_0353 [Thermosulfurimonas dismutans]|uniref:Uncharacterized protein n=2 Tax=Thermosulfurimonas dismutans TaxID=999894 RepID=A0A179D6X1_9BACT|nr:hypothetical protein TDIS_0353 [Thermosulfurimonas dismutans]